MRCLELNICCLTLASAAAPPDHADSPIGDVNSPELARRQPQSCAQQRPQQALVRDHQVVATGGRQQICCSEAQQEWGADVSSGRKSSTLQMHLQDKSSDKCCSRAACEHR
jgi:hypothetical protein